MGRKSKKRGDNIYAAAAKLIQSCPTLCDPIDGSVPGILQARILEWDVISFSSAWKWKVKVKSFSPVWFLVTPWTAAHQAPPSMGFARQECWSGVPLPSPTVTLSLHSHQHGKRIPSPPSFQCLLWVYFLSMTTVTGMRWRIIALCVSLIISDVEHLFTCFLAFWKSSVCLFRFPPVLWLHCLLF